MWLFSWLYNHVPFFINLHPHVFNLITPTQASHLPLLRNTEPVTWREGFGFKWLGHSQLVWGVEKCSIHAEDLLFLKTFCYFESY